MDMKVNRNRTIGILLSLGSVLLTCTLYLGYKLLMMEGMNRDMNMEYSFLQKKNEELEQKLAEKEKAGSRVPT